jgi:uncharacterized peroxidase-related enzyme
MTFIETVRADRAEPAVAAMYLRQQSAWGFVPNYAKAFSHRPEVMERWGALLAEIKRPMQLRRFELATFVAAHELRNTACALAHGTKLREFFDDAEILAIAQGEAVDKLTGGEVAILRFARRVARDASQITRDEVDALRALGLADAEVFDIAAAVAARAFFTKVLDALGVQADSASLRLADAFREGLTVGRPIDEGVCVVLPAAA